MDVHEYIKAKKAIQTLLLKYIDDGIDEDYNNLIKLINESNVSENRNELKSILQIISTITKYHHRSTGFFSRIEKILTNYIIYIKQYFSQSEVFDFFNPNQRILLFLLQNNLISTDNILNLSNDYIFYFYPEIKTKIDQNRLKNFEESHEQIFKNFDEEEFNKDRLVGENNSYICQLIRGDSIDEFIKYVNKENITLSSQIQWSPFETNSFLIRNFNRDGELTLFDYAYFFGSIQIVNYLIAKGQFLRNTFWPFAIHSNNAELINMLEEKRLIPIDYYFMTRNKKFVPDCIENDQFQQKKSIWDYYTFKSILIMAIQCHHIDVYNYIKSTAPDMSKENESRNSMYDDKSEMNSTNDVTSSIFEYYNYLCFPDDIDDQMIFFFACIYDYTSIVELFLKNKKFDINAEIISH